MKTEKWDPHVYRCVINAQRKPGTDKPMEHAKGCRGRFVLRRDPTCWAFFYSVECAAQLDPETRARLVRCVPTKDKRIGE